ncbi:MAG: glycosyltransferase family 2 protein [Patescibacteria group bacterium]
MKINKVAAIIPAYNEQDIIAEVVAAAKKSDLIDEVIVVSDGSTDKTVTRARAAGASKVLDLKKNLGKGMAMVTGVEQTKAEVIVFLDADVHGLKPGHIKKIVDPVLRGSVVMNIGVIDRGRFISNLAGYMPLISGERALQRFVIERIPKEYLQGFKIETALNYYCRSRRLPYDFVFLPGVSIKKKIEKVGFFPGLWQYFKMIFEIIDAMIVLRWAKVKKIF